MRYIPIFETGEEPDPQWLTKAKELTELLEQECEPEKRKAIIETNKVHWGMLRAWLLKFSAGKCWYSEAKDCVQYWEVEHFRPKNAGKDAHVGYWWLSFDWHNYRIAGQVINRKKGSYFRLRKGSFVANAPSKPFEDESPCLLDPADESDCRLIFFDETGRVIPKPGANAWERYRVSISRDRYNLDYQTLVDSRKTLWQTSRALAAEYLNLMKAHCRTGSISKRAEAKKVLKQLRELARFDAPFSTVAASCVLASNEQGLIRAVLANSQD